MRFGRTEGCSGQYAALLPVQARLGQDIQHVIKSAGIMSVSRVSVQQPRSRILYRIARFLCQNPGLLREIRAKHLSANQI